MPEIRAARFADALSLAPRLRYEDAREIAASWGVGPEEGLFLCLLHSSQAFTLVLDETPEALWGVCAANERGLEIGVPWMLAGERMFAGNREILAQTRRVIRHLLLDYDVLTNVTDAENTAHLRWLAWCGFRPLRRHARHGVAGRAFIEFYQINARRGLAEDAVRAVLERRRLPSEAPLEEAPVRRMARAGISLLDPAPAIPPSPDELTWLLREIDDGASTGSSVRRNWVRLMLECAVTVTARRGRCGLPGRHTLLGELMDALAEVADLLVLEGAAGDGSLVLAMAPPSAPEGPRPTQRADAPAERPAGRRGTEALEWLLRRYVRLLTLDGRVSRGHGWRLWAASLCVPGEGAARQRGPLGEHEPWQQTAVDHLAELTGSVEGIIRRAQARRALLQQPLVHGAAMTAIRSACGSWSRLGRAVQAEADRLFLSGAGDAVGDATQSAIGNVGQALAVCSAIADRTARMLLPGVRLGGVVAGYADRHWLYRLLRARLLETVAAGDVAPGPVAAGMPDGLGLLLADDVAGLLLALRLEARLLSAGDAEPGMAEVAGLLGHSAAPWFAAGASGQALRYLIELLVPPMAVPAAHRVQLEPAMAAGHLSASGKLAPALEGVDDLLAQQGQGSRLRYRKFLRALIPETDMVWLGSRREWSIDAERRKRAAR